MTTTYILNFSLAFVLSLFITPFVKQLSSRLKVFDHPGDKRKVHTKPIPRIGGIAIVLAFLIPVLISVKIDRQLIGLLSGLLIIFSIGLIDDIKGLSARTKLIWQVIAAGVVLAGGIGIVYFSNPFGAAFKLDFWRIPIDFGSFTFNILPIANLISIIWIVGIVNTVNFLDGLDGLATGVSAIAALVLFIFALSPQLNNSIVALLSIILLGSLIGFLPYNFFPSTIFMGDGGAYSVGLVLATVSIYSTSKIAVGVVVLGFAILDSIWVVTQRLRRKQSPFSADKTHLHHRLLGLGFNHRQAVLLLYTGAALLAVTTFISFTLAVSLLVLCLVVLAFVLRLNARTITKRKA